MISKKCIYIFFMMSCSLVHSMDNAVTTTLGAVFFSTGMGLVLVAKHNNQDFMKKRKPQYIDGSGDMIQKTLYFDEWTKEVAFPLLGGSILMISGLILITKEHL